MTSAFEPLIRIGRTAFPYWLIAAVLLSLLVAFIDKKKNEARFLTTAIAMMGGFCGFVFMFFGVYVELTGKMMSFIELLPSSLVVSVCFWVPGVIHTRSKQKLGIGESMLFFALGTVWFTVGLAFLVSFSPKLMPVQIN